MKKDAADFKDFTDRTFFPNGKKCENITENNELIHLHSGDSHRGLRAVSLLFYF
jgi:hypothetical protein